MAGATSLHSQQAVVEVEPDVILDVAQGLIVGVSLAVAALEWRARLHAHLRGLAWSKVVCTWADESVRPFRSYS